MKQEFHQLGINKNDTKFFRKAFEAVDYEISFLMKAITTHSIDRYGQVRGYLSCRIAGLSRIAAHRFQ